MTPIARTGERSEVYRTTEGDVAWRYFGGNGEEVGRSAEGLHPDHGVNRAVVQVNDAHPGWPTWVEVGDRTWVLFTTEDVNAAYRQEIRAAKVAGDGAGERKDLA